jgi:indolepyruvate ferredoxin oxidoreductase alpha subunit
MGKYDVLLSDKEQTHFLLGNEAIARGVIEAGVGVATTYPGTPSSEVGDALSEIAKPAGGYFEISTNEMVALEVAAASAMCGVRSFVSMKHVGMNVASDSLMSVAYTGTKAGLVIMTADDPSMWSSQNEQDNRHYSDMSGLPLIEPSNPQEAKDFIVYAFDLSEKVGSPVIFRTTTRVSHMRGVVKFGPRRMTNNVGTFEKDPSNMVLLPATAYRKKEELLKRLEILRQVAEKSPLNRVEGEGVSDVGVITSGAAYNSLSDVVDAYGLRVDILKLGFSNPLPDELVASFLKERKKVIVVEELDPVLERQTRALSQLRSIPTCINGKMDGYFPHSYEYNSDRVAVAMAKIMGFEIMKRQTIETGERLPPRPPVLCPGCPHRATYYAVELASKQLGLKTAIFSSDIGCYALGIQKPFLEADYALCMGSSIGAACGFSRSTNQPVIAFIGDSTFFHAGLPGLANAIHNNHRFVLVILDNRTTAMTGNQPNPGVAINGMREQAPEISVEAMVKAMGVKLVRTVDPSDIRTTLLAVKEAIKFAGVSVVISKRECALLRDAEMRASGQLTTYVINQDKCTLCRNCIANFSCPAFYVDENGLVKIDQALCDGCGICAQALVCGPRAIEALHD